MMIFSDARMIAPMGLFDSVWTLYEIYIDAECVYLGATAFRDLSGFVDARNNSEFARIVKPDSLVMLRIMALGEKTEILNEHYRHVKTRTPLPRCNAVGYNRSNTTCRVQCVETGEIFASQVDCARKMRISQPLLSMHLNGRRGYRHVQGKTFKRII